MTPPIAAGRRTSHGIVSSVSGEIGSAPSKPRKSPLFHYMGLRTPDVDSFLIEECRGCVANRDYFHSVFVGQSVSGNAAYISETLYYRSPIREFQLEEVSCPFNQINHASPCRLPPAIGSANTHRLPGHYFGHCVSYMRRIGVHKPRHHLLIGSHIWTHYIRTWTDERYHFLHVPARQAFELAHGELPWFSSDSPFCAAIGQACDRTLPAHPHCERGDLTQSNRFREPRSALSRPHGKMMLHPITLKDFGGTIV